MIHTDKLRRLATDIEDGQGGYTANDAQDYATWLRLQADAATMGVFHGDIAWMALVPPNVDTEATLLAIIGRALEWARPTAVLPEHPFPGGVEPQAVLRVLDYWRARVQANIELAATRSGPGEGYIR